MYPTLVPYLLCRPGPGAAARRLPKLTVMLSRAAADAGRKQRVTSRPRIRFSRKAMRLALLLCLAWLSARDGASLKNPVGQPRRFQRNMSVQSSRREVLQTAAAAAFCLPAAAEARIGTLPEFSNNKGAIRRVVLNTANMDKALAFYGSLGMDVLRDSKSPGFRAVELAFGQDGLDMPASFVPGVSSFSEYGGHTVLELRERTGAANGEGSYFYDPGNVVDFLQFGVPNFRISKLIENGGTIVSSYGWTEVLSPDGLRHRVVLGRRLDPFMMIAVKTKDVAKTVKGFETDFSLERYPYPTARPVANSPFEPPQPKKSVYLGFDAESTGILVVPSDGKGPLDSGSILSDVDILYAEGEAKPMPYAGVNFRFQVA